MSPADINAVQAAELVRHAMQIADAAVVADIESEGLSVDGSAGWYDVRPMLSENEHSTQCIDMATQALRYAVMRGLAQRHPDHAHLVRITRSP